MADQTPRVMILHAPGTNRDRDAALACTLAGGAPEIVHINEILFGEREFAAYQMLVLPGGFPTATTWEPAACGPTTCTTAFPTTWTRSLPPASR